MPGQYGTNDVFSSVRAQANNQTVAAFGEDRLFEGLREGLRIHNEIMRELVLDRAEITTRRLQRAGGNSSTEMKEFDEYGIPDAQRVTAGANLGLPLSLFLYGLQFTRTFLLNATAEEVIAQVDAGRQADIRNIRRRMLTAMFRPTNRLTYVDRRVDRVQLPVRALLNADGWELPPSPFNATEFNGSTHTHFLYATSFSNTSVRALLTTVREHGIDGRLQLDISETDYPTIAALTGFVGAQPTNIVLGPGRTASIAQGALNQTNTSNRFVGVFDDADVWVKPWQIAGYATAWDTGSKPIAMRVREGTSTEIGQLNIVYENEDYPLRAQVMEREFDFGVVRREKMAHLYVEGSASAYVMPTIP